MKQNEKRFWAFRKFVVYLAMVSPIVFVGYFLLKILLKYRQKQAALITMVEHIQHMEAPNEQKLSEPLESWMPPLRFGINRFYYLYNTSLPQLHLILISILQGLAFGVLLLDDSLLPDQFSWDAVFRFLLQEHPYLQFIGSSLVILLVWMDFVYASLIFIWPASFLQAGLIYLIALTEILTFKEINNWLVWYSRQFLVKTKIKPNRSRSLWLLASRHLCWRVIVQRLMQPLLIVKREVRSQIAHGFSNALVIFDVDLLIFDTAP